MELGPEAPISRLLLCLGFVKAYVTEGVSKKYSISSSHLVRMGHHIDLVVRSPTCETSDIVNSKLCQSVSIEVSRLQELSSPKSVQAIPFREISLGIGSQADLQGLEWIEFEKQAIRREIYLEISPG